MKQLARFPRGLSNLRFRILGLATIKDIPGDGFKILVSGLQRQLSQRNGIHWGHPVLANDGVLAGAEWAPCPSDELGR